MSAVFPTDDTTPLWFIGQHETNRQHTLPDDVLRQAQDVGYDMITVPITTAAFRSRVLALVQQYMADTHERTASHGENDVPLLAPLTHKDTVLTPSDGNSGLIGLASAWIDLGSRDPLIAHISRQVFNLEVAFAAFCGISNIIVHGPLSGSDVVQFARPVLEGLGVGPYLNIQILLPMNGELEQDVGADIHMAELVRPQFAADVDEDDDEEEADSFGAWEVWDTIRTLCNYSSRLAVALEIPRQMPSTAIQNRWYSEPVRLLSLPRISFLRNAKGYPVLHKAHQQYFTHLMRLRFPPWMILSDVEPLEALSPSNGSIQDPTPADVRGNQKPDPVPHLRYMRHLQQSQPPRPPIDRFGQGYQDFMQSPLQPLTDNLESITYEVFEKDPVKYDWYERATALALVDLSKKLGSGRPIIVAVVGSGRGPLVSKALLASRSAGVKVKCWAVEKNQNAYVHLQRRNLTDNLWNGQVTVVKTDMRAWTGPIVDGEAQKVDIMISELLGSFADNELSPECLDGVQHVLHPDHGINIPQSYSAHFTPISTPRLYSDLLSRPGSEKWEVPAVVMLRQYDTLCLEDGSEEVPEVKEAWSFSHPLPPKVLEKAKARAGGSAQYGGPGGAVGGDGSNEHNSRFCKVAFKCRHQGVCHGLAGYFETVLYRSDSGECVELSTNPTTMEAKSKDMISWFPIFFPIKTPLHVPADAHIEVNMWRFTDDRKVWYEWVIEVFDHVKARKRLGMSELHSSRRHGCLM